MKNTLQVISVLLVGACAASNEPTPEENAANALRDSVVGVYEGKVNGTTHTHIFTENGIVALGATRKYSAAVARCYVVGREIFVGQEDCLQEIYRINTDGSITFFRKIRDKEQIDTPKVYQHTYKMFKQPSIKKALEEKVIGTYKLKDKQNITGRFVFLKNNIFEREFYDSQRGGDFEKLGGGKWEIEDGQIQIEERGTVGFFSINPDGSITATVEIKDGIRKDIPKENQTPWVKI